VAEKQSCVENRLSETKQQKVTLQSTIDFLNGQISVQELKIEQTEAQISQLEAEVEELSARLSGLEVSLDKLGQVFVGRIQEQYKQQQTQPVNLLLLTNSLKNFLYQSQYLLRTQQSIKDSMERAEEARLDYDNQKKLKEEKQAEVEAKNRLLEAQQRDLKSQRGGQQQLLAQTQSNEARFQDELSKLRAEMEAIQAIIAGSGDESKVGEVHKGDQIASVIAGASCNSSGSHLHFMVVKDNVSYNPFAYLSGGIDYENCSGSGCGSGDGDPFNPSGSWDWPLSPKIKFNQGYGATWAVRNSWVGRIYSSHNGIDINSPSAQVKAVQDGTSYRGSYSGSGGCRLRYVRLEHKEGGISTYYLHVNY